MLTDCDQTPEPDDLVSMADKIRFLCSVVTKLARADLQTLLDHHNSGISAIEHGVLRHLSHGIDSMAEISRLMGVAPSTLVYVVDGLVRKRLVRRGKDPDDRRREPLALEKKGAALFGRIPKMDASNILVKRLKGMKAARRRDFLALLVEFSEGLPGSQNSFHQAEFEVGEKAKVSEVKRAPSTVRARKR